MEQFKIRKGNVILRVSENQLETYMQKGFDIIAENGNIIKKSIPTDVKTLQAEYSRLVEKVALLEKQAESQEENVKSSKDDSKEKELQEKIGYLEELNSKLMEELESLKKQPKNTGRKSRKSEV